MQDILCYQDDNGDQNTGLHIDDWQKSPAFWNWRAGYKKAHLTALPERPLPKTALLHLLPRQWQARLGHRAFAQRVFVGKNQSKTALVVHCRTAWASPACICS